MNKMLWIISLIALVLSGCTYQLFNNDTEMTTGLDSGSVKVIREDEGPSQGGTLNLFMFKPDTLNPLTTKNPTVRQLSSFVFDSLFYEGEDGISENGLVEDFTFSQDGLILDIKLRDNILFHDGQALTAYDVAFTVDTIRISKGRSLYENHVANIESVKAIGRLNLRLILKTSDSYLTSKLTFPIIPQHIFKNWPIEGHNNTMKLIGTGAFQLKDYMNEEIILVRNDSWWYQQVSDGLSHPIWLDGITFKVFPDESEMMLAFQKQEIDIAYLNEGELESYAKRADIFLNQYKSNNLEFLVLSALGREGSPIANEDLRALLIKYLSWYALGTPLNKGESVIEFISDYAKEHADSSETSINRGTILEALAGVGFIYQEDKNLLVFLKNGTKVPVTLSLRYNGLNVERKAVSQWITAALFEIGINVTSETTNYAEQKPLVKSGKFDMMLLGCRMPLFTDTAGAIDLVKNSLGVSGQNAVILTLYRKNGAVLYHNRIRGPRTPVWKNIYNGWSEWYLVNKI